MMSISPEKTQVADQWLFWSTTTRALRALALCLRTSVKVQDLWPSQTKENEISLLAETVVEVEVEV